MGEPTHDVIRISNGAMKSNVKTIITVVVSVGTLLTSAWVGWVSAKSVDHENRMCVIESTHVVIKEDLKAAKETIAQSREDLSGIKVLLSEIRDDQKRRQRQER
jgi:hypothetical protein